jgi:hypothetical protein
MFRMTPKRPIWIEATLHSCLEAEVRKLVGKCAYKPFVERTRFLALIAVCAALAVPLCTAQALYNPGSSAVTLGQLADSHSPMLLAAIEGIPRESSRAGESLDR